MKYAKYLVIIGGLLGLFAKSRPMVTGDLVGGLIRIELSSFDGFSIILSDEAVAELKKQGVEGDPQAIWRTRSVVKWVCSSRTSGERPHEPGNGPRFHARFGCFWPEALWSCLGFPCFCWLRTNRVVVRPASAGRSCTRTTDLPVDGDHKRSSFLARLWVSRHRRRFGCDH